jgi:hypothetical protein
MTMDERRKLPRHRTLKAGSISFNRAGGIDCRVRNLSPAGACLEVAFPTTFCWWSRATICSSRAT